jgi:diaminopimelate decarboxylase
MNNYYTEQTNFYKETNPKELLKQFGSPLYVYNEAILRERCKEMAGFIKGLKFQSNYSIKANSNLTLLKIINEEGLFVDAMSPGEIQVLLEAGFSPNKILYIGNNVSEEEMRFAIERNIDVSIDSVSQLITYGKINQGGRVAIRFNPGVGAGHHEKVVTAGKKTKFGVNIEYINEVKEILKEYNLNLIGINQHIGSLFMEGDSYFEGVNSLLTIAEQFENLEFIDFGGGFGIPYHKQEGQQRLELKEFGEKISQILLEWMDKQKRKVTFKIEPGRYIVAECGVILGSVHVVKKNGEIKYIGTDIGFNVLARPVMYDSHHEIEVYKQKASKENETDEKVTVVGNICESGDIIAKQRLLPHIDENDILGVMDAGAYGYSMSSNYNNRLRPAEVLIRMDGSVELIRRRDTIEDLLRNFK